MTAPARQATSSSTSRALDELSIRHDSVMVEACNTSFQVHYQVGPEEFAELYNLTQAVAGPVLAAACNSPLLFGRRLWRETRIALFQQSVDHRAAGLHLREQAPRVYFGRRWVDDSVLEIFREDIARFRVLLSAEIDENPFDRLRADQAPAAQGAAPAQRHHLPLEPRLLRHSRRQAAPAHREPDPARRPDHPRRGGQRRVLVRAALRPLARLSRRAQGDGVRRPRSTTSSPPPASACAPSSAGRATSTCPPRS